MLHARRVGRTELVRPPVFILGHWRSGTTLMHELMTLDDQFAYPNNYEAFVPHHFLVSQWLLGPLVSLLLPRKRPMDNMKVGSGTPQEDDFALLALGATTPYRRMAYPNRPGKEHISLNGLRTSPTQRTQLQESLDYFYRALTLKYGKTLLLKSPPHTGRIGLLNEWFPGAKFIHISRHPYRLVPSTMHLWRSLDQAQAFQVPRYDDVWLKNFVFECQDLMYQGYVDQARLIPPERLVEVAFEDLVQTPEAVFERVYQQLQLEGLEEVLPRVRESFAARSEHKQNQLPLEPHLRIEIDQHWSGYMERFGYQPQSQRSSA